MHVAIVGAGPAGATLALLLARNGARVTLLERESNFDRVFRGEGLMPSGVDALHQMGLGGLLDALPFRILESWDIFINGRAIMSVPEPYEELGDRAMRVIPQKAFLEAVIDQASQFSNFTFIDDADASRAETEPTEGVNSTGRCNMSQGWRFHGAQSSPARDGGAQDGTVAPVATRRITECHGSRPWADRSCRAV